MTILWVDKLSEDSTCGALPKSFGSDNGSTLPHPNIHPTSGIYPSKPGVKWGGLSRISPGFYRSSNVTVHEMTLNGEPYF